MAKILIIHVFRILEINQKLATVIKKWNGICIRIDIPIQGNRIENSEIQL